TEHANTENPDAVAHRCDAHPRQFCVSERANNFTEKWWPTGGAPYFFAAPLCSSCLFLSLRLGAGRPHVVPVTKGMVAGQVGQRRVAIARLIEHEAHVGGAGAFGVDRGVAEIEALMRLEFQHAYGFEQRHGRGLGLGPAVGARDEVEQALNADLVGGSQRARMTL